MTLGENGLFYIEIKLDFVLRYIYIYMMNFERYKIFKVNRKFRKLIKENVI